MLLRLAWSTVRHRKASFAGSFVAMASAQALVTMFAVVLDAGARAAPAQGGEEAMSFAVPFGFICLFVSAFAVAGTFSLSVQQRTREIALLRAVAATPGQVRRLIAYEAFVVAAVAAVPGCGLGILLAAALRAWMVGQGWVPDAFPLDFGPWSLLIAVAICSVTAQLAVRGSGRRASRVRPVQALGEAAVPSRRVGVVRTSLGLAVLVGGIWGLSAIDDSGGSDAANTAAGMVMVFMIAVGLLAPWIGKLAGAVFGTACLVLLPVTGSLVRANLTVGHRRLGAAVSPLALTVAFAAVLLFVPQMKWHEQERQDHERLVADYLVRTTGQEDLPDSAAGTVGDLPGVAAAIGVQGTHAMVLTSDDPLGEGPGGIAQAVTDGPLDQVLDLAATPGGLDRLGPHDIALSRSLARQAHADVGDTVWLSLDDDRTERSRVAAVYARDLGFGDLVVPRRMAAAHLLPGDPSILDTVYVRALPGQQREVAERLAALTENHPAWQVLDRSAHRAEARRQQDASTTATYLLLAVVTVFTSISVVNTLVMTTMERTGEFALLRLVGSTRTQVARMMRAENIVTVLAALLVGSTVAGMVLVTFSKALTGSPYPSLPGPTLALIVGGAGVLALVTGVLTTRIALRQRPSTALRDGG
ncbi:putative ABC transport system integral membrane protein [Streptomyces himastatinicus ATCC 53653]|uniref:Putative ABC transport system integral membrane protein n=1 Tax=Streptomyces himastatinicus ATCC 53653 TaxID=457427 RepID=D9WVU7_9ACTN|nr:FtsX-like permease family protein [Streptomyces himastatinicus]EFL24456.1 putative ABC transport system integral membrane protein [Streptomyces himastatinicus ATCC 53653]